MVLKSLPILKSPLKNTSPLDLTSGVILEVKIIFPPFVLKHLPPLTSAEPEK